MSHGDSWVGLLSLSQCCFWVWSQAVPLSPASRALLGSLALHSLSAEKVNYELLYTAVMYAEGCERRASFFMWTGRPQFHPVEEVIGVAFEGPITWRDEVPRFHGCFLLGQRRVAAVHL